MYVNHLTESLEATEGRVGKSLDADAADSLSDEQKEKLNELKASVLESPVQGRG